MFPKNDGEYVKSSVFVALAVFAGAFLVLFFLYGFLSERILLTFAIVTIISLLMYLKDLTRKIFLEIKALIQRAISYLSSPDQ